MKQLKATRRDVLDRIGIMLEADAADLKRLADTYVALTQAESWLRQVQRDAS